VFVDVTVRDSLVVSNAGSDNLTVSSIAADHTDYAVSPTGFMLVPGESKVVAVSFKPSAIGQRNGVLTIASNDLTHPQLQVRLAGEGVEPPVATVNPAAFEFRLREGDSATAVITISNTGGSPLAFKIRDNEAPSTAAIDDRKLYWTEGLTSTPIHCIAATWMERRSKLFSPTLAAWVVLPSMNKASGFIGSISATAPSARANSMAAT
jgi:hypothetical protein